MDEDDMVPAIIGAIKVAKFAIDTITLFQNGDITQEELDARWDRMRENFQSADDLWESS